MELLLNSCLLRILNRETWCEKKSMVISLHCLPFSLTVQRRFFLSFVLFDWFDRVTVYTRAYLAIGNVSHLVRGASKIFLLIFSNSCVMWMWQAYKEMNCWTCLCLLGTILETISVTGRHRHVRINFTNLFLEIIGRLCSGGLRLKRDVSEYAEFVRSFKAPAVDEKFKLLGTWVSTIQACIDSLKWNCLMNFLSLSLLFNWAMFNQSAKFPKLFFQVGQRLHCSTWELTHTSWQQLKASKNRGLEVYKFVVLEYPFAGTCTNKKSRCNASARFSAKRKLVGLVKVN